MLRLPFAALVVCMVAACEPVPQTDASAEPQTIELTQDQVQLCSSFGELGEVLMKARQSGIPFQTASLLVNEAASSDATLRSMAQATLNEAYRRPIAATAEGKAQEIAGFGGVVQSECQRAIVS